MAYSRHIFIQTNSSCNLKCSYCYEQNKDGKLFDEQLAISKLEKILSIPTQKGTKIKLIGGEPFMAFQKIKLLCETIWSLDLKEQYFFQITTNGTLVHGEIQDWLRQNKKRVECKLSLDGAERSHNINRNNSFNLIDIKFFTETWEKGTANMVVTPVTLPFFYDNVTFLHTCGFYNIVPIFAVLTEWNNEGLEKVFYEQLTSLAKYYLSNPLIRRCQTLNNSLERVLIKDCDYTVCDIGRKLAFDINTDKIYPCHLLFPSVCGQKQDTFKQFDFSKRSNLDKEPCQSCVFVNICHTCYAANLIERGAFANRDMIMCRYRKISFLVDAKLEYNRIMQQSSITDRDYSIMMAIKNLIPELHKIEISLSN